MRELGIAILLIVTGITVAEAPQRWDAYVDQETQKSIDAHNVAIMRESVRLKQQAAREQAEFASRQVLPTIVFWR